MMIDAEAMNKVLSALESAESFISGFEDDLVLVGIDTMLDELAVAHNICTQLRDSAALLSELLHQQLIDADKKGDVSMADIID